ncbi:hypothetical protein TWF706_005406 [Orbilia oligospora]|nr:hypothetical protein TWF103_002941 [Orbilia oligospora]KAF3102261.1 hypothetical protein TWF706_005406 [Orbilia oligospora]
MYGSITLDTLARRRTFSEASAVCSSVHDPVKDSDSIRIIVGGRFFILCCMCFCVEGFSRVTSFFGQRMRSVVPSPLVVFSDIRELNEIRYKKERGKESSPVQPDLETKNKGYIEASFS